MKARAGFTSAGLALLLGWSAHASIIIDFNRGGGDDNAPIPQGYGSTEEVTVEYLTPMLHWTSGYGALTEAAFSASPNAYALIALTPKPGYQITLERVDIGNWAGYAYWASISVLDADGSILSTWDYVMKGVLNRPFDNVNLTSTEGLIIKLGPTWDIAIDNIQFAATPVPEPTTLFAGSLLLLPFGESAWRMLRKK